MASNREDGIMASSVDAPLCSEILSFTSSMTSATASVVKVGSVMENNVYLKAM